MILPMECHRSTPSSAYCHGDHACQAVALRLRAASLIGELARARSMHQSAKCAEQTHAGKLPVPGAGRDVYQPPRRTPTLFAPHVRWRAALCRHASPKTAPVEMRRLRGPSLHRGGMGTKGHRCRRVPFSCDSPDTKGRHGKASHWARHTPIARLASRASAFPIPSAPHRVSAPEHDLNRGDP